MTAVVIQPPEYRSSAWQEWRRQGLGASELPAIVGADKYRGEYQLAAEKRGETPGIESTDVMRFGAWVEEYGVRRYEEDRGVSVVRGETFRDDRWPHCWATLDGRVDRIGVEVKYASRGWDALPQRVEVQALGQIAVADLEAVDVVRINARGEVLVIRVERDERACLDLMDLAEAWYERYALGSESPPLDGSPAARRALDRLVGTAERPADERQASLLAELRSVRARIKALSETDDAIVRDLKASMAGCGVLSAPIARVTWAPVRGRSVTDWKAAAEVAARDWDREVWQACVRDHTTTGEPSTRFAVRFEEETE